jgi:CRISP-associated protein Cas1
MIKRTLYFGNPTYLSIANRQLVIKLKINDTENAAIPVEDIGFVLLDHAQITVTHEVIRTLLANNAVIVSCNDSHMPAGMMLPIDGHHLTAKNFTAQVECSTPLKKQLWQQTVIAKITNQAGVLARLGKQNNRLLVLAKNVQSGDNENCEGQAAAYYWRTLFQDFIRDADGLPPNNLLNYGYAILRSIIARALVSSGLNPTLGIHHHNQYNHYCLADDIMEPYRPYVDYLVYNIDIAFGSKTSPLMVGVSHTTASLVACYLGLKRKIVYPDLE